ncbi:hypothetical protein [Halorubrum sp. DTA98]|uniref:hypothetical protein n=1 Tax=Halorubrum sp. DTA98 TaxID=3402163 RepID=UPI003AAC8FDC
MADMGERVRFDATASDVRVRDVLEDAALVVTADREPDPQPALTELFPFPVDDAISFETSSITLPSYSWVAVRGEDGDLLADLYEPMTFDRGTYCLEVTGPTKVYVRVTGVTLAATGMRGDDPVRIEFDEPTCVTLGARSLHTRPEATVTVPDDPEALMTAVSALGSSIKEFSPERSWPTLRGYPPRIRRGDELHVPDLLSVPDAGIRIELPPTDANVYRIAPLAFYLGATVEPGPNPAIHLETGYTEPLPSDGNALEDRIEELLGTCLLLDSLARTEGYVPSDRYEYERIGSELPFYPPKLADRTPSERLMEYLEVDRRVVEPHLPNWPVRAVLRPTPAAAELLPHLAHVLAPVRIGRSENEPDSNRPARGRDAAIACESTPAFGWSSLRRSDEPFERASGSPTEPCPPNVAVLRPESYENRLDRTITQQGSVDVAFVIDSAERAERIRDVMDEPGAPDGVESWTTSERPSREELIDLFEDPDLDLLCCLLPLRGERVRARDGVVDLSTLSAVPPVTVFEGSTAVDAGLRTVSVGAIGSIAAADRIDPPRLRTITGLLAVGTPLGASVRLSGIAETGPVRLVGGPTLTAATPAGGVGKSVFTVRSRTATEHDVTRRLLPSTELRVGSETNGVGDWSHDRPELIGTVRDGYPTLRSWDVVDVVAESDSILRLNGSVILANDGLTEDDVERSARRALRERADPPDER